jgi:hypothetical protein
MFKVSGAIRSTTTADGAVLLDIHRGKILSLNRVGCKVFEMLEVGADQNQIAGEISEEFGVDAGQVRDDVLDFIRTLQEHHVLEASQSDLCS